MVIAAPNPNAGCNLRFLIESSNTTVVTNEAQTLKMMMLLPNPAHMNSRTMGFGRMQKVKEHQALVIAAAISKQNGKSYVRCEQKHLREFKRKHAQETANKLRMRQHFTPRGQHGGCAPHDYNKNSITRTEHSESAVSTHPVRRDKKRLHRE
ncbi:MAG TPA: hypothetical protein VFA85_16365 [Terriglobales bacterium]|nr:hypothetical protein [Terriglobales bacterium]